MVSFAGPVWVERIRALRSRSISAGKAVIGRIALCAVLTDDGVTATIRVEGIKYSVPRKDIYVTPEEHVELAALISLYFGRGR